MMPHRVPCVLLLALAAALPAAASEAVPEAVRHDLEVTVDPATHRIDVFDRVTIPEGERGGRVFFALHAGLTPTLGDEGLDLRLLGEDEDRVAALGLPAGADPFPDDVEVAVWEVAGPAGSTIDSFGVHYEGTIHHPIREVEEEYARAFGETPGTIGEEGVYLAASTFWYPWLGEAPVAFSMRVDTPPGWDSVSEGKRAAREATEERVRVVWEETRPQEEIHLVAGPWTVYEDRAGRIATYVYLRADEPGLARTFLDTAAQYLGMYEELIGAYPYDKFAVVENFWETGYGMASFTLLGPRVIRFPFILHSSFPHEILHNWWGNGVWVVWDEGNWCEGLTAYLADHLVKEQRGQGAEYRRDLLQKYADYVREGLDFPLTEFRSRHSSATQAVGYGKTAMVFHMLRRRLGDDTFVAALRTFWKDNRFRRASWDDVRAAFESVSEQDLGAWFDAWVTRPGAPALSLGGARAEPAVLDAWNLRFWVKQDQGGEPLPFDVPVAVTLDSGARVEIEAPMVRANAAGERVFEEPPVYVEVDPEFDLFRRLDLEEIPPSFGRAFGSERVTVVLPSAATGAMAEAYADLAAGWSKTGSGEVEVVRDADLAALPEDRSVWVFGAENRHREAVAAAAAPFGGTLDGSGWTVGTQSFAFDGASVAVAARHPASAGLAVAFLSSDRADAVPGLGRKLPHYGKYGWLAFEGAEPDNVGKGQWDAVGSPLATAIVEGGRPSAPPARAALAELPALFSAERMRADVEALAAAEMEGRGCGTDGLARAADRIEAAFAEAGLAPGWNGAWRQTFAARCGAEGREVALDNVVGVIPGENPKLADAPLVVVAHYDHLGTGWPDVREGEEGKVHPGADDNASGVAVMLELARVLGGSFRPARPVIFLSTAGEEAGLLGARAIVGHDGPGSVRGAIAALNLDTVGRLGDGKLLVLGSGSADEWVHVVRGAGWVTGVAAEAVRDDPGGSDQVAFLEAGIPAVQFFTGPHADYHRSSDTVDRVDVDGLVDVATFVREFVTYLADREEPLASRLGGTKAETPTAAARSGGRRVSLGTVPDFAWQGGGYRLDGVTPGSPAEAAGLAAGDVLVRIDDTPIEGLRDLSEALKGKAPGDVVAVTYVRDGEERTVEVALVAR